MNQYAPPKRWHSLKKNSVHLNSNVFYYFFVIVKMMSLYVHLKMNKSSSFTPNLSKHNLCPDKFFILSSPFIYHFIFRVLTCFYISTVCAQRWLGSRIPLSSKSCLFRSTLVHMKQFTLKIQDRLGQMLHQYKKCHS